MRQTGFWALGVVAGLAPVPASAEVASLIEHGFASHHEVLVDVPAERAWADLLSPRGWWNGDHSYSGDASNLTIEPRAGGCFCETVPGSAGAPGGQVEHMRVIHYAPNATLRLSGGLGPLQGEAVTGVLTVTLAPEGDMTRISWDYVVGGYMRFEIADIAPSVDAVVGEQLLRLATRLGAKVDPAPRRPGS